MKQTTTGFTIVELLIVIVIIAILTTITIVAYNGIQNRANDASVQSDLNAVSKKTNLSAVEAGNFPRNDTDITALGLRFSKNAYAGALFCYVSSDGSAWAMVGASRSGNNFYISNTSTSVTPYTAGAVLGVSGSVTCANTTGSSSPSWRWFVQAAGGAWWDGVN